MKFSGQKPVHWRQRKRRKDSKYRFLLGQLVSVRGRRDRVTVEMSQGSREPT